MATITYSTITYATPAPVFTPPANCFGGWTLSPYGNDSLSRYFSDYSTALLTGLTKTCFPSGLVAEDGATDALPTITPAQCPSGYSAVAVETREALSRTQSTCCPTLLIQWYPIPPSDFVVNADPGPLCTYSWKDSEDISRKRMPATDFDVMDVPVAAWYQTPLVVQWGPFDLAQWPTSTWSSKTGSTTSEISMTSSTSSSQSTLAQTPNRSTDKNVEIGLGVAFGSATLLLMVFGAFVWQRRKERRGTDAAHGNALAQSHEHKPKSEERNRNDIYELPSPENAGRGRGAELGSNWHGTEAPALIEVESSRPQQGCAATKIERSEELSRTS